MLTAAYLLNVLDMIVLPVVLAFSIIRLVILFQLRASFEQGPKVKPVPGKQV